MIAALLVTTAMGAVLGHLVTRRDRCWAKEKMRVYCEMTRSSIALDRHAFAAGDSEQRQAARARFYDRNVLYHSAHSIEFCLDELPSVPSRCLFNDDWDCLAEAALQIEHELATKVRDFE
jgi:hypothetical protein